MKVTIFSRRGCHLCDVAEETVRSVQDEVPFDLEIVFIDGNEELEKLYGEEIPVTMIDGKRDVGEGAMDDDDEGGKGTAAPLPKGVPLFKK